MKAHSPKGVFAKSSYSLGVEVAANARWLYVSGQVGVDSDGKVLNGIEAQATQIFRNLTAVLNSAGMGFEHVVKLTSFLVDERYLNTFRAVREPYISANRPASTVLIVQALAQPAYLVEVEAVAAME